METEKDFDAGKIALWTGAGCIVLVIGMVLGCVFSIGGLLWLTRPPKDVTVLIDAPIQIDNGEEVEFKINVTNHGTDTLQITGVNLGADYLNGISIGSVTPAYTSVLPPSESSIGEAFQNYDFLIPISPGETVSITFKGTAIASGDYGGSLDVCVNSNFSCIAKVIRTVIK